MVMWFLSLLLFIYCITLLICICWTILVFLEGSQLDHVVWTSQCPAEFSLPLFYWRFSVYVHQRN
jgi:hypothetical protein